MLKDILNRSVVSVTPDTKIIDVAKRMNDENVGAIVVCVDHKPRGLVTDRDIAVRCVAKNLDVNQCKVEQIISEPIECAKETDGLYDCITKMKRLRIRRLPVVDAKGNCVSLVSFDDLVAILSQELSDLVGAATPAGQTVKAGRLSVA